MASAIRSTRIFSPRSRDAGGQRRRARLRPAGDAGERRAQDRSGGVDAAGEVTSMSKINRNGATLRHPPNWSRAGWRRGRSAELEKVAARYAVAVTPDIAALIDPGDPDDPIARQFIPSARNWWCSPARRADPIGDHAHSPVAGIVHRYPDRVLFKLVHVCAVYCRFCFRREMVGPGKATALSDAAYRARSTISAAHGEIWEVILTGGDPLMLSPRRLAEIMADLAAIDHVKIIRFIPACRSPIPRGSAPRWSRAQGRWGATTWVALHANHPRELTERRAPPARGWSMPAFRWSASRCCCAASMTMRRRWKR
jgi:lysine 2,3-aminomutase